MMRPAAWALFLHMLSVGSAHEISHVVVAMLENRAFDHMLGWMARGGPSGDVRVDGLTGKECNLKDVRNASAGSICVNDQAQDECPHDPDHLFAATTERIFGCRHGHSPNTPCDDVTMTKYLSEVYGTHDS